jgi:hypothetical protein
MPTFIALPTAPARPFRHIEWEPDAPAQINRSGYTGKRSAVTNPWHVIRRGRAQLVPIIGEANVRPWRAFFAALKGQTVCFMLPATEGPQYSLGLLHATVVNHVNMTVASLGGSVYRATKSGGVSGTFDADVVSSESFSGDAWVRVQPKQAPSRFLIGFNADPLTDSNYLGIDRALFFHADGTVYFFESSVQVAHFGAYNTSDFWFVRRASSGVVTVWNGASTDIGSATLVYTATSLSGSVFLDSSFANASDQADIYVEYTTALPTAASGAAQGATSITLSGAPTTLTAGMMATVSLPSGNKQLVILTADIASNVITFEPPLREAISTGAQVDVANPACQVAMASSAFGWSVDPGQQYGIEFDFEEVF